MKFLSHFGLGLGDVIEPLRGVRGRVVFLDFQEEEGDAPPIPEVKHIFESSPTFWEAVEATNDKLRKTLSWAFDRMNPNDTPQERREVIDQVLRTVLMTLDEPTEEEVENGYPQAAKVYNELFEIYGRAQEIPADITGKETLYFDRLGSDPSVFVVGKALAAGRKYEPKPIPTKAEQSNINDYLEIDDAELKQWIFDNGFIFTLGAKDKAIRIFQKQKDGSVKYLSTVPTGIKKILAIRNVDTEGEVFLSGFATLDGQGHMASREIVDSEAVMRVTLLTDANTPERHKTDVIGDKSKIMNAGFFTTMESKKNELDGKVVHTISQEFVAKFYKPTVDGKEGDLSAIPLPDDTQKDGYSLGHSLEEITKEVEAWIEEIQNDRKALEQTHGKDSEICRLAITLEQEFRNALDRLEGRGENYTVSRHSWVLLLNSKLETWRTIKNIPTKVENVISPSIEPGFHPSVHPSVSPSVHPSVGENTAPLTDEKGTRPERKDPKTEIDEYLQNLKSNDSTHFRKVKEFASSIEPMGKGIKVSVAIPVAGHQKSANIFRTLSCFTNQTLPREEFEIVLHVNRPDVGKGALSTEDMASAMKKTLKEIVRFKKENPDMPVRVIEAVLPNEEAKIGIIRKQLTDTVLMRHQARKNGQDYVIVSADADTKGISPKFLEAHLKTLQKKEASLGMVDWDTESFVDHPAVHIGTRFLQYIGIPNRNSKGFMNSPGGNFGFRASAYSAVGGYAKMGGGEDSRLGEVLNALGGGKYENFGYSQSARIWTDARRAIATVLHRGTPMEQWNNGFGAFDELRTKNFTRDRKIDFSDPEEVKRIEEEVEDVLIKSIEYCHSAWDMPKNDPVILKALGHLGVKYEVDEKGEVSITNLSKLMAGIQKYQTEGIPLFKRKVKPAKAKEKKKEEEFNVGDEVLWENSGVIQWPEPKEIKSIQDDPKSGEEYAFFEGSDTSIPVKELILTKAKKEEKEKIPANITAALQKGMDLEWTITDDKTKQKTKVTAPDFMAFAPLFAGRKGYSVKCSNSTQLGNCYIFVRKNGPLVCQFGWNEKKSEFRAWDEGENNFVPEHDKTTGNCGPIPEERIRNILDDIDTFYEENKVNWRDIVLKELDGKGWKYKSFNEWGVAFLAGILTEPGDHELLASLAGTSGNSIDISSDGFITKINAPDISLPNEFEGHHRLVELTVRNASDLSKFTSPDFCVAEGGKGFTWIKQAKNKVTHEEGEPVAIKDGKIVWKKEDAPKPDEEDSDTNKVSLGWKQLSDLEKQQHLGFINFHPENRTLGIISDHWKYSKLHEALKNALMEEEAGASALIDLMSSYPGPLYIENGHITSITTTAPSLPAEFTGENLDHLTAPNLTRPNGVRLDRFPKLRVVYLSSTNDTIIIEGYQTASGETVTPKNREQFQYVGGEIVPIDEKKEDNTLLKRPLSEQEKEHLAIDILEHGEAEKLSGLSTRDILEIQRKVEDYIDLYAYRYIENPNNETHFKDFNPEQLDKVKARATEIAKTPRAKFVKKYRTDDGPLSYVSTEQKEFQTRDTAWTPDFCREFAQILSSTEPNLEELLLAMKDEVIGKLIFIDRNGKLRDFLTTSIQCIPESFEGKGLEELFAPNLSEPVRLDRFPKLTGVGIPKEGWNNTLERWASLDVSSNDAEVIDGVKVADHLSEFQYVGGKIEKIGKDTDETAEKSVLTREMVENAAKEGTAIEIGTAERPNLLGAADLVELAQRLPFFDSMHLVHFGGREIDLTKLVGQEWKTGEKITQADIEEAGKIYFLVAQEYVGLKVISKSQFDRFREGQAGITNVMDNLGEGFKKVHTFLQNNPLLENPNEPRGDNGDPLKRKRKEGESHDDIPGFSREQVLDIVQEYAKDPNDVDATDLFNITQAFHRKGIHCNALVDRYFPSESHENALLEERMGELVTKDVSTVAIIIALVKGKFVKLFDMAQEQFEAFEKREKCKNGYVFLGKEFERVHQAILSR